MAKVCSGIYKITNTVNGKVYVGKTTLFGWRWHDHKRDLKGQRHFNKLLQEDWNKYGESVFSFEVLERIEIGVTETCHSKLLSERERYWMKVYQDNIYNGVIYNW